MTQLIGGQVNSEPWSLLLHLILVPFGVSLQKRHDSVVSPLPLGLNKVNLPESHNARALKGRHPPSLHQALTLQSCPAIYI